MALSAGDAGLGGMTDAAIFGFDDEEERNVDDDDVMRSDANAADADCVTRLLVSMPSIVSSSPVRACCCCCCCPCLGLQRTRE